MPKLNRPAGALLGAGMVALAGMSAVKIAGARIRGRHDAALDDLQVTPAHATHRHLPTHDGGELHVVEVGTGRPVVLLHGVTLQWWVWDAVINLLADRYRVLAWDMRGHGESRAGSDGVTLEAVAADLATVLRELDLEDAIVVGHSMGGMAIGHFARHQNETLRARVAGLCFLATSASTISGTLTYGSPRTWYGLVGKALVTGLKRPTPRYPWPDNDLSALLLRMAFGPAATGETIEAVRQMSADMSTATLIEAGNTLADHDVRADLAAVDVPTVVVVGDVDRLTPPGHAREIARIVPGASLTILPGIGHQVMQEHPAAVVDAVDELARRSTVLLDA